MDMADSATGLDESMPKGRVLEFGNTADIAHCLVNRLCANAVEPGNFHSTNGQQEVIDTTMDFSASGMVNDLCASATSLREGKRELGGTTDLSASAAVNQLCDAISRGRFETTCTEVPQMNATGGLGGTCGVGRCFAAALDSEKLAATITRVHDLGDTCDLEGTAAINAIKAKAINGLLAAALEPKKLEGTISRVHDLGESCGLGGTNAINGLLAAALNPRKLSETVNRVHDLGDSNAFGGTNALGGTSGMNAQCVAALEPRNLAETLTQVHAMDATGEFEGTNGLQGLCAAALAAGTVDAAVADEVQEYAENGVLSGTGMIQRFCEALLPSEGRLDVTLSKETGDEVPEPPELNACDILKGICAAALAADKLNASVGNDQGFDNDKELAKTGGFDVGRLAQGLCDAALAKEDLDASINDVHDFGATCGVNVVNFAIVEGLCDAALAPSKLDIPIDRVHDLGSTDELYGLLDAADEGTSYVKEMTIDPTRHKLLPVPAPKVTSSSMGSTADLSVGLVREACERGQAYNRNRFGGLHNSPMTPRGRKPGIAAIGKELGSTAELGATGVVRGLCAGAIAAAIGEALCHTREFVAVTAEDEEDEVLGNGASTPQSPSLMSIASPRKRGDGEGSPRSPRDESPSIIILEDPVPPPKMAERPRTPPRIRELLAKQRRRSERPVRCGVPMPLSARARCTGNEKPLYDGGSRRRHSARAAPVHGGA